MINLNSGKSVSSEVSDKLQFVVRQRQANRTSKLSHYHRNRFSLAVGACMCVALGFALSTQGNSFPQSASQKHDDQIMLPVAVTNENDQPIRGLPQSAFRVLNAGIMQPITSFDDQDRSASIALVLDPSTIDAAEYRDRKRIPRLVDALADFIASGHPANEYFLIRLKEAVNDSAPDRYSAGQAVAILRDSDTTSFHGNASIYYAYHLAISKVSKGANAKRALVMITDGLDFSSRNLELDVDSLINEKSILVYVIFMTPEGSPVQYYTSGTTADIAFWFKNLAETTGGMFFHARSAKDVNAFLQRVAGDLRSRYTITFRPTVPLGPGKCFPFKLNVTPANASIKTSLNVRTRRSTCS